MDWVSSLRSYEYDDTGALLGITDALGHSLAKEWTNEQPSSSTSRSGVHTAYTFDEVGRVLTASETAAGSTRTTMSRTYWTPDTDPNAWKDRRIASSTDAAGVTTTYTYDGDLNVPATSSVPCDENSLDPGLDCPSTGLVTTSYEYDTDGPVPHLIEQTDPDGARTSSTYHEDESHASYTVYDDGDVARTTTYERWYRDHVDFPFAASDNAAWADRVESPGGSVSWKVYNPAGLVIIEATEVTPELGGTQIYYGDDRTYVFQATEYFSDGTVNSVTDSSGHGTQSFRLSRATDSDWSDWEEDPSVFEVRSTGIRQVSRRLENMIVQAMRSPHRPATSTTVGYASPPTIPTAPSAAF